MNKNEAAEITPKVHPTQSEILISYSPVTFDSHQLLLVGGQSGAKTHASTRVVVAMLLHVHNTTSVLRLEQVDEPLAIVLYFVSLEPRRKQVRDVRLQVLHALTDFALVQSLLFDHKIKRLHVRPTAHRDSIRVRKILH